MKIAYIFAYFGDGGAETHALLLAKKAKENGESPFFIISDFSASAKKKLDKSDIDYVILPMRSSFNPVELIKSVFGLKKIVKSQKVDIVHAHMLREQSVAAIAKLFGERFILIRTFHRFDQFNLKMKPLLKFYGKYTDAFISISDEMTKYMNENGIAKNVFMINNGVEKVKVDSHERAIGFIGRLAKEKGVFEFLKANQTLLHDVKMVIAGEGPEYSAIKEFVKEKRLNVELMGNVQNKADFFEKISVLVLPSRTEVLPLVVLEAYSCGLPVVAFNLKSLRNLISDDNGRLVDFPDYLAMGEAATALMNKREDYEAANINLFNQKYSDDIMWQNTSVLYRALNHGRQNMLK